MRVSGLWYVFIEGLVFCTLALILFGLVASGLRKPGGGHSPPRRPKEVRVWCPENLDPEEEDKKVQSLREVCRREGFHFVHFRRIEGKYRVYELMK